MVEIIASALGKLDPHHSVHYQENARLYRQRLKRLLEEIRGVVQQSKNPSVITFHDIFDYLARDTGLKVVGVIQPQLGVEPSPREMARLVKVIRTRNVAAIFSEPQVSDRIARALCRETGLPCYELDPVATGKPLAETYEKAMQKNLDVLRSALK
jgi:zinc transport system substrate-binding protein